MDSSRAGNDAIDHVDEIEEDVLDLVGNRPLDARMLGRLPHQGDLVAQPPGEGLLLGWCPIDVLQAIDQELATRCSLARMVRRMASVGWAV